MCIRDRDVIIATLLGADRYGFGTLPLLALGCKMVRQCHENTCPVGIATQDENLRAKFVGAPEQVMQLFKFIAEDVRDHLKKMGVKKLQDIIGQTKYLEQIKDAEDQYKNIDLSGLIEANEKIKEPHFCTSNNNDPWDKGLLANEIMKKTETYIDNEKKGTLHFNISNRDRSIGAKISGYIAGKYGEKG